MRPAIYVELSSENFSPIGVNMLVDSGADITIIPERIGLALGFEKSGKKRKLSGISGSITYYEKELQIKISKTKILAPCAWVESDAVPLLLGRNGVFDKFRIVFDEKKSEVVLSPLIGEKRKK